ncbi:AmmeMemoRadiSam system protein B [Thalassovita taeanensis]|uniref:Poly-gamma-glutamate synthesis protein (Capsule biosynthesis protein) n=1 Tax=Thalassovita taeanensis TaxID=657014 RepID=A0A1H9L4I6_9RHOB|nr:AmmeMemoRadiSam system protein B [Thalassovita taeanensis]SER06065.1 poly-gamma-glutamate synthesis protein (capsule biosynthesis protein) [Thalassovita taeanensis]
MIRGLCAALAVVWAGVAAAACPQGDAAFAAFYPDAALFRQGLALGEGAAPAEGPVTGVIVPHHLEMPELIAGGLRMAAGRQPDRIVILFPDHFFRLKAPFGTTQRGFDTVLGPVPTDAAAAGRLAQSPLVEETCLFDREHGVRAVLPFVAQIFPGVEVVPVAVAISSDRREWDAMADLLAPLLGPDSLLIQATDFSHYLPHHEARLRDQQVLNLLAAGDVGAVAGLVQPDHVDSVGAMYLTMVLQQRLFGAVPVVVANRNLQELYGRFIAETTSYVVAVFAPPGTVADPLADPLADPAGPGSHIYMLAGDLFLGRGLPRLLSDEVVADRVAQAARRATRGLPLIANLEGVLLPDMPNNLPELVLGMPGDMLRDWAGRLNLRAVGLANNHVNDIGASGVAETHAALTAAGIARFGQGEALALPGVTLVGLSDLDGAARPPVDRLTPEVLDRVVQRDAQVPVVAFVHWGREFVTTPGARERQLEDALRQRGVAAIVGAHPHAASAGVRVLAGGDVAVVYSLGNFLFDQLPPDSSGALVELRSFAQGTVFVRQLPLPHLYAIARGGLQRE